MANWKDHINYLERNDLDSFAIDAKPEDLVRPIDNSLSTTRIHGISKLWTEEDSKIRLARSLMADAVTGLIFPTSQVNPAGGSILVQNHIVSCFDTCICLSCMAPRPRATQGLKGRALLHVGLATSLR